MPRDPPQGRGPRFWTRAYPLSPATILGLSIAGHTTVPCPEENKCEPTQTRPFITGDSGLTPQPLTEIRFLKFDETTTILEFSAQKYCLQIIKDLKKKKKSPGVTAHPRVLARFPPAPVTPQDNEPFQMVRNRGQRSRSGDVSLSVPARTDARVVR